MQAVKGSSILTKVQFVEERFGSEAACALAQDLESLGLKPVLAAEWYDYRLFDQILTTIAERHYGGQLAALYEIGGESARQALTTTYDFLIKKGDVQKLLDRLPAIHRRYYRLGALTVGEVDPEKRQVGLRLDGAPSYADSDLHVAAGFYSGAAEMMGLDSPECRFEHRAAGGVDLMLRWR